MSAWGNKTSTAAKSWDDDDEEKLPDFPGLGDSFGPPPTTNTTSSSSQFPSLGEAQKTSKKKKGTKLSLAEFSGITSSVSAPITDDNVYRPSRGGSGGGSDHVDVYALPKAPNRERREEEESERRRPGELGGAFKDYGGDRGGGGGGGYGGGRDRDEDGGERGDRYDRRGGERGDRYDRRGGERGTGIGGTGKIDTGTEEIGTIGIEEMSHLAAEGETTIAISTKTGESEGASRNRVARIPATGRNERASERTIDTNPFASVRD